jgi:hypothetical protein
MLLPQLDHLTPEQHDEARRIFDSMRQAADDELWRIAQLLASKPDDKLLGKTEFEVRDRVHTIGAKAIETALNERKKGATKGPV